MRTVQSWNEGWLFSQPEKETVTVALPHTWNAEDGTDGGNDYFRGSCTYTRTFSKKDLPSGERYYLEIGAANSSADVTLNGSKLLHHDGGYSAFRAELTDALQEENTLVITVDNAPNDHVYPQIADFTFYGGLYRGVSLIAVNRSHFALMPYATPGIRVTSSVNGRDAVVRVETELTPPAAQQQVRITLLDHDGKEVASARVTPASGENGTVTADSTLTIDNAHLWNGRKDPYLYLAVAELLEGEEVIDRIETRFGVRTFAIDAERGFILNGTPYPLRGVSRHQDRAGYGNALLKEHHEEDIALIEEVGATTIRLAHYQHAPYFYDLCDEKGMVVWAEIPYISRHLPNGNDNTISQMTELITQNSNHPSIVCWGLSNEITMGSADEPGLVDNHRALNDLAHRLDPTRKTVMAVVSMCDIHAPYIRIPDAVSYNHYFGWYGGDTSMNGPWLDRFHKELPDIPIGLSEYGCEGLDWHSSHPDQGDYTEEYQAYYHEELIKQLFTRDYLWATHVWNMFDFGADSRSEGGEPGQNHKGLVTFDRKYKKDAFYAYKAWLSDDPFVHLCGKRYTDRVEDETKVTVYSNQKEVALYLNDTLFEKKTAEDHFFYFTVPNRGETTLKAVAGDCTDTGMIRKVETFNEDYRLKETGTVLNWFDIEMPEGYFSLNDKFSEIMKSPEGVRLVGALMQSLGSASDGMPQLNHADLMQMLGSFTVLRMTGLLGVTGKSFTKEELLALNAQLNKIKKP
ncbi:MAG: glycoside hydrolase family 2 protein [Lachnospiraceae bacterium]|nr:glycoside hydrolase family 2 protein [Lachnospiraceae bacterium]